jgi:glycerol dehydrogenase
MSRPPVFFPHAIYAPGDDHDRPVPRVFISPQRYIQGIGVLNDTGRFLLLTKTKRAGVMASKRGLGADGGRVIDSLASASIESVVSLFGGECSTVEIDAHVARLEPESVDCLIAVGGGKCVDAGKAVAYRLGIPVVIVPTLASSDAPCSAVSVIYTPDGVSTGLEFFPESPALVIVDTGVVAEASERFLAAGMGDAMATWYEARVCLNNEEARTPIGARPTLASCAIGKVCAETLYEQGEAAAKAVAAGRVDESLEKVVEANTLLSGLGFESGGLAAAHGIAQSYTMIPAVNENYLHGEMVAMGLVAQLVMESKSGEARKAATFFARVGLPIHLGQLSLGPEDSKHLDTVVESTINFPLVHNMPFSVTAELLRSAILDADELGVSIADIEGDEAYRRLHAG